jgi:hypothetical protein
VDVETLQKCPHIDLSPLLPPPEEWSDPEPTGVSIHRPMVTVTTPLVERAVAVGVIQGACELHEPAKDLVEEDLAQAEAAYEELRLLAPTSPESVTAATLSAEPQD